jgi:hypothetical protein
MVRNGDCTDFNCCSVITYKLFNKMHGIVWFIDNYYSYN